MLTEHPPVVPEDPPDSSSLSKSRALPNVPLDLCRFLVYVGGLYFLIVTSVVVPIVCTTCFLLIYPLRFVNLHAFNVLEHCLCRLVNDHWVAASLFCGLNVIESGDDIEPFTEKRCLLLCNHVGLIDHFVLMTVLQNRGSVPSAYLWVIYNIWKWTPLGVMWTAHGNFFVNGGARQRETLLHNFKQHLKANYWTFNHGWIVMYPEGSRFFLIKESSKKYAEKLGVEPLKNCALPRTGAAHAVMEICGPIEDGSTKARFGDGCVEFVVDVTLGYQPRGQAMTMGEAMFGDVSPIVNVHYRVLPVKAEWAEEAKLRDWLFDLYHHKDHLLEQFIETGAFPGEQRPLGLGRFRTAMAEFFWIAVFYVEYNMVLKPLIASLFISCFSLGL